MFEFIRGDFSKKLQISAEHSSRWEKLGVLSERGALAVVVYRFGHWARERKFPVFGLFLTAVYYVFFYLVQMFTGISIQAYTKIGPRFVVRNYSCIFVLAESIGSDFTVCEGVTVGNIRGKKRLPIIGDNVFLEPGCKVLGEVTLGSNVIVRANSLVLSDIPDNSIAVGNPARISRMEVQKEPGSGNIAV